MVECLVANENVVGSSPTACSKTNANRITWLTRGSLTPISWFDSNLQVERFDVANIKDLIKSGRLCGYGPMVES